METLKNIELKRINGGHKGTAYTLGAMWMDSALAVWGFVATIAEGIEQEISK